MIRFLVRSVQLFRDRRRAHFSDAWTRPMLGIRWSFVPVILAGNIVPNLGESKFLVWIYDSSVVDQLKTRIERWAYFAASTIYLKWLSIPASDSGGNEIEALDADWTPAFKMALIADSVSSQDDQSCKVSFCSRSSLTKMESQSWS